MSTENEEVKPPVDEQVPPQDAPKDEPPKEESISAAEYKKLMKELEEHRSNASALQETLKHKEMQQLKDQERWKEIAELREKEANEYKDKYTGMTEAVKKDRKMHELKIAAQAAGIRKEAFDDLELYDFPEVQIETTSLGNVRVVGAREAIENLRMKRPHLFGKSTGALNSSSPEAVNGGKITIEQIKALDSNYRKTKSSADLKAYQDAIIKYKSQQ